MSCSVGKLKRCLRCVSSVSGVPHSSIKSPSVAVEAVASANRLHPVPAWFHSSLLPTPPVFPGPWPQKISNILKRFPPPSVCTSEQQTNDCHQRSCRARQQARPASPAGGLPFPWIPQSIHPLIRTNPPAAPPQSPRSWSQSLNSQPSTLNLPIEPAILSHISHVFPLTSALTTFGLATSKARTPKMSEFQFWRRNPPQPPAIPLNPPGNPPPLNAQTCPQWDILSHFSPRNPQSSASFFSVFLKESGRRMRSNV